MNLTEDNGADFITDQQPPSDNRRKIIIAAAAAVVILCCCCGFLYAGWTFGDQVIEALGL